MFTLQDCDFLLIFCCRSSEEEEARKRKWAEDAAARKQQHREKEEQRKTQLSGIKKTLTFGGAGVKRSTTMRADRRGRKEAGTG